MNRALLSRTTSLLKHNTTSPKHPHLQSQSLIIESKPITQRNLSTTSSPLLQKPTIPDPSKEKPKQNQNPSFGGASLKDLGATRAVKIVVIVFLSICGTLETIAWGRWIWGKFIKKEVDVDEGEEGKE